MIKLDFEKYTKLGDLTRRLSAGFNQISSLFDGVNSSIDTITTDINNLDTRIDKLEFNKDYVFHDGAVSGFYNIKPTDSVITCVGASSNIILPTAVGVRGKTYKIIHLGLNLTNVYTMLTTGGQTIGGVASGSYALYTNDEVLEIISNGTNWEILNHYAETGWVDAGALTITATTTNPTKPSTVTRDKIFWKRSGNNVLLNYQYKAGANTGAAAGSGMYLFNMPSGITLDTAITNTNTGTGISSLNHTAGHAFGNSSTAQRNGILNVYANNQFSIFLVSPGTGQLEPVSNTLFALNGTTVGYGFNTVLPVVGWQP